MAAPNIPLQLARKISKFGIESKAEAVRLALANPALSHWTRRGIRDFAIRNWKARRGNKGGRPHPSEKMDWHVWLSVTRKRRIAAEARWTRSRPALS